MLQFNRGVPAQIVVYNYPFASSINNLHSQAVYFTDTFSLDRVHHQRRCPLGALPQLLPGADEGGRPVRGALPGQDVSRSRTC